MKTGIVMHIENGKATVMERGGTFRTLPAKSSWKQGDVVTLGTARVSTTRVLAVAASLLIFLMGSFGTYTYVNADAALVSFDMKPSIELIVNRMGRVKQTVAFNDEGASLLSDVEIVGQPYRDAITALMQHERTQASLQTGDFIDISIHTPGNDTHGLVQTTEEILDAATQTYPSVKTSCRNADGELVRQAHAHSMTPGKYMVFLQLQADNPELDAADFTQCHTGEMRRQLRKQNHGGNGGTHGGKGYGHGHGWE